MRWILALIAGLLGAMVGEEGGLFGGLALGFIVGWAVDREKKRGQFLEAQRRETVQSPRDAFTSDAFTSDALTTDARIAVLTRRVERLEQMVQALSRRHSVALPDEPVQEPIAREPLVSQAPPAAPAPAWPSQPAQEYDDRGVPLTPAADPSTPLDPRADDLRTDAAPPALAAPQPTAYERESSIPPPLDPIGRAVEAVRGFFLGGNTVVRIGVVVLTVGLALLVRYAAEQAYFPLELRLSFAALIAIALVAVGYRLRRGRPGFGTALQGGGVAGLYLVTFFAYYAYKLVPAPLTLALLVAIAVTSSLLAVVQDAVQLAVFGAVGGFLAPILASSGGGSHVALFSYYALLNAAICGMALFRAWRVLNWVGFVFTFGVASAWGALKYEPANMASASLFLALFFLFYVAVGTLFALRQPAERRGTVDTTLTFGTPLATLALAGGLFRLTHLYLALACVTIAAVYLVTARVLLARRDPKLGLLTQAYVAIGIGIGTLAIPFALDHALATALAWAVEATGLVWVGVRQARLRTRIGGYVLFFASIAAIAVREQAASPGGKALFFLLIALGFATAAALLERGRSTIREFEQITGYLLLACSLALWFATLDTVIALLPASYFVACWLGAGALTTLLLEGVGTLASFATIRMVARFSLPALLLCLPTLFVHTGPAFAGLGRLGLVAWMAAGYFVLSRQRALQSEMPLLHDALHASGGYVLAAYLASEAHALTSALVLAQGWIEAATLLAPLAVVPLALAGVPRWPVAAFPRAYRAWAAWPIALATAAAALLCQGYSNGAAAPLPYVPLLSPLDLAQWLVIAAVLALGRTPEVRRLSGVAPARIVAALSLFVGLNGVIVRTAHHWADVPFEPFEVPTAPLVQAAFSILWAILALLAMVLAHRKQLRRVWIVGAALLGIVVVKLFLLDLARLSSVAKIVTFLAVGVLLLVIGYFAPVPPPSRPDDQEPS